RRPAGRPVARLTLRKQGGIFGCISFPADAFSAQGPCFPATRLRGKKACSKLLFPPLSADKRG
ncbi:MAG: hypothetical protein AMJ94_20030, partial [Deltaproteobacteria bacterium SM23_61]